MTTPTTEELHLFLNLFHSIYNTLRDVEISHEEAHDDALAAAAGMTWKGDEPPKKKAKKKKAKNLSTPGGKQQALRERVQNKIEGVAYESGLNQVRVINKLAGEWGLAPATLNSFVNGHTVRDDTLQKIATGAESEL